jgi:FMN-dependent NADH-azoreductase
MTTLLRIDSSARQRSVTRHLTGHFVEVWRRAHPSGTVIERDLATTPMPSITDQWDATYSDPGTLTERDRRYLATSDQLIAELFAATVIVIGAPMYNLSISSELKRWIDQIVRVGKTIAFGGAKPRGLLYGRRTIVVTARGGSYVPGTRRAGADFQEPYLRAILSSLGLSDLVFIHAEHQKHDDAYAARRAALERIGEIASRSGDMGTANHGVLETD